LTNFPIHICSLEGVREADISLYDGVITIENSFEENPFRYRDEYPKQLILRFDDISVPVDEFIEPEEKHVLQALSFAEKIGEGSILIHCHAGISRSSAIALAIITKKLRREKEFESINILEKINPHARPNKLLVWLTDEILERNKKLYDTAYKMMWLTN
jgi:predicted protein tyrosine phosphatase